MCGTMHGVPIAIYECTVNVKVVEVAFEFKFVPEPVQAHVLHTMHGVSIAIYECTGSVKIVEVAFEFKFAPEPVQSHVVHAAHAVFARCGTSPHSVHAFK